MPIIVKRAFIMQDDKKFSFAQDDPGWYNLLSVLALL